MPAFGESSRRELATAHPDLQRLFELVIQDWDCKVLQGARTEEEQRANIAKGVSKTMNSKHLARPARAVDVVPFPVDWNDLGRFYRFAEYVKGCAKGLGIKIVWGGDWRSFKDMPHYELAD